MTQGKSMTAEQVGEYFDDRSWLFSINGFNLHIGYFDDVDPDTDPKERHTDVLIEAVGLQAGQRLLDVGCGFGRPAIRFVQRTDADVLGINVSEEQIRTANRLAAEAGVGDRAKFEVADANRLPYPDGSFDAVWAVEVLMYLPDRLTALKEIHRVLAPGGTFVLSDYTELLDLTDEQREALAEGFTVDSLPTSEQYDDLLSAAGFTSVRSEDATPHLHKSAARIPQILADNYDLIAEKGGREFAEEFRAMLSKVAVLERDYMGYVIKVLRKK
ncbi:cyclopropane fatty-acyl-phospholipid synthase-like methyltransferase [Saccharothrix variisporea]|uniref:Cyclopropane fatty-acyl-phospholipid synthase-like methyltransferase n=2 Tax=Saccharothrix variisporea TaxID=543527 RepID=A0A495XPA0_9PSEU|nr:cyclopropane fatty-acyl-phospholipid synthase-like methyltransferase [Saccharothrix variisporea]